MHPPANFSIGGNKGYLHYMGQPYFCRTCFCYGHTKDDCGQEVTCRNCKRSGHEAGRCPFALTCDISGLTDHTCRNCPNIKRQYEMERYALSRRMERAAAAATVNVREVVESIEEMPGTEVVVEGTPGVEAAGDEVATVIVPREVEGEEKRAVAVGAELDVAGVSVAGEGGSTSSLKIRRCKGGGAISRCRVLR